MLKEGAEREATDLDDSTALLLAAKAGKAKTVKCLLDAGANPDAKDDQGKTALMYAGSQGQLEVIRDLLGAGAYVNMRDYSGLSALDWAGYTPPGSFGLSPFEHRPDAAALLLKNGATSRE